MSGAKHIILGLTGLSLTACAAPSGPAPEIVPAFMAAEIETDADGRCFGRDITPAVIETVTAQVLDQSEVRAEDGTMISPAVFRSEISQQITRERQVVAFETICPPAYTVEFVQTLQRALAARGFYNGQINGHLDVTTGRAIQNFQREDGPDSPVLWIATARELGIVALSPDQIEDLNAL